MRRRLGAVGMVTLGLCMAVGCSGLRVAPPSVPRVQWGTEGGSAQRSQHTPTAVQPPLTEVWRYGARAGFGHASPLLTDTAVIVATRRGEVHAIDRVTGKRLGAKGFGDAIEGTPVTAGDQLYVPAAWGRRALYAYDLRAGRTSWTYRGPYVKAGLTLSTSHLIVANEEGGLQAFDPQTGAVRWSTSLGEGVSVIAAPALIPGGPLVVVTEQGDVAAFDPETGALLWQQRLLPSFQESVAAWQDQVYVASTRGRLTALEAVHGRPRWAWSHPDSTVRLTAPAIDSTALVVAGTDGVVRMFDPADGSDRWTYAAPEAITAPPLLTPTTVLVGGLDHQLHVLDRATGRVLQQLTLTGRVKSPLAAHDGQVVVLAEPDVVFLFEPTEPDDADR
ncbi:MAG: PQQ-binding-like beta-propeller repeat protein [Bacteroidota bacterium]